MMNNIICVRKAIGFSHKMSVIASIIQHDMSIIHGEPSVEEAMSLTSHYRDLLDEAILSGKVYKPQPWINNPEMLNAFHDLRRAVTSDYKVGAVKAHRTLFGSGLREAKEDNERAWTFIYDPITRNSIIKWLVSEWIYNGVLICTIKNGEVIWNI